MDDLVSPFDERTVDPHAPAPRLDGIKGKKITLLSISKPKSTEFLAELGRVLEEEHGAQLSNAQKPTFTRPAPDNVFEEVVKEADAVVEALAD
jgi:hypothetical protein